MYIYTIFRDWAIEMLWSQSILITCYCSFKSIVVLREHLRVFCLCGFVVFFFNRDWPRDKKIWYHITRQGICKSFRHSYFLGLITTTVFSLPSITLMLFYSFHRWNIILLLECFTLVNTGYHCILHSVGKYFININTILNIMLITQY